MRTIVWFRGKDLRISDHEPLYGAAKASEVIPLFILDHYFFATESARAFSTELIWREFSHSTLWDRPTMRPKKCH